MENYHDKLWVINGLYYSDGAFIEPLKKNAQRMRQGQANNLKRRYDRIARKPGGWVTLEEA